MHEGNPAISTPGAVVDSLDIQGFVTVKAANVTIRRSIVRGLGPAPSASTGLVKITQAGASGFLVEDTTLVATVPHPNIDGVKVNQAGTFVGWTIRVGGWDLDSW